MKIKFEFLTKIFLPSVFVILLLTFSGCIGENNNGKIKVSILDAHKNDIKSATVKIDGVAEKGYPFEFSGLKPYKTYNISVSGLGEDYLDAQSLSVEATKLGTEVVINIGLAPTIVVTDGIKLYESLENNGSLMTKIVIAKIVNGSIMSGVTNSAIKLENLPPGLTYEIQKCLNNEIIFILSGKAIHHTKQDSISNLKISIKKESILGANKDIVSKSISLEFKSNDPSHVFAEEKKEIVTVEKPLPKEQEESTVEIVSLSLNADTTNTASTYNDIPVGIDYFTVNSVSELYISNIFINMSNSKEMNFESCLPFIINK